MPTEIEKAYLRAARKPKKSIAPQAPHTSMEEYEYNNQYNEAGTVIARVGAQEDGGHGTAVFDSPAPDVPSAPILTGAAGAFDAYWDGGYADPEARKKTYHSFTSMLVSADPAMEGAIAGGSFVTASSVTYTTWAAGTYYVAYVSESTAGRRSAMSEIVSVVVAETVTETRLNEATTILEQADADLAVAAVELDRLAAADGSVIPEAVITKLFADVVKQRISIATEAFIGGSAIIDGEIFTRHLTATEDIVAQIIRSTSFIGKSFEGGRFYGGDFETVDAPDQGIKMLGVGSGNEIVAHNPAGDRTFVVDGDTGAVTITGTTPHGQTTTVSGMGMQVTNEDGSIATRIGTFGEDYVAVGDEMGTTASISSEGVIAGSDLNIESDPTFMGRPLLGATAEYEHPSGYLTEALLDYVPRGMVARGYRGMSGIGDTYNREREILELSYTHYPDHAYRITVTPWSVYAHSGVYVYLKIYYTDDGSRPTMSSPNLHVKCCRNNASGTIMFDLGGVWYDLANSSQMGTRRYLFTYEALNGICTVFGSASDGSQFRVWVEDMGLDVAETGLDRTGARTNGGSSPGAPAEDEAKNYTKTYYSTNTRSYQGNGNTYAYNTGKMYQGQSPAGYGDMQSIAVFPSMTGDLSGAEIQSMKVHFYFEHWYYNAGGRARIGVHNQSSLPSNQPTIYEAVASADWPKPGGRWVNIPSSFWNGFKTGTHKGVALGRANGGYGEYGIARGSVKIEVKYKK